MDTSKKHNRLFYKRHFEVGDGDSKRDKFIPQNDAFNEGVVTETIVGIVDPYFSSFLRNVCPLLHLQHHRNLILIVNETWGREQEAGPFFNMAVPTLKQDVSSATNVVRFKISKCVSIPLRG